MISSSNKRGILQIIGSVEGKFLTKYLGAPMFLGRMTVRMFDLLVEKI